jgi:aquaporin NIP
VNPGVAQINEMFKRLSGEFLGTFGLVFCGTGAIIINQESEGVVTHLGVAITFGLIVMVMILSFGHISGAHINPAVSIALCIAKRFKWNHVFPYVLSQLAGALLASLVLHFLFPKNELLGASLPRGSDMQSLVLEFLLSFLLMVVILTSTAKKDHSLLGPALAIGGTVGLEALFAGPICGASMNPARSLGPAIVGHHYQSLFIYILGPLSGTVVGSFVFLMIKENDIPATKEPKENTIIQ